MHKFTSLPVRKETHQTVKIMAARHDLSMYELIDMLVEKGEDLMKQD